MNWNEFAEEVHQVAVDHGWWEKCPTFPEVIVMCHSELSEAVEEYRAGNRIRPGQPTPMVYYSGGGYVATAPTKCCTKPEGIAVELADCILRILDWAAAVKVDIDAVIGFSPSYDDVIQTIARCHYLISSAYVQTTMMTGTMPTANSRLLMCIETIMDWAHNNGVDMEAVLRAKHEYNKTRPNRHGGKVL